VLETLFDCNRLRFESGDATTRAVFNNNRLQIVAVILCSTGVALLAYMDAGVTNKKKTMTGVLLAALAAAGSAVYKVSRNTSSASLNGVRDHLVKFSYVMVGVYIPMTVHLHVPQKCHRWQLNVIRCRLYSIANPLFLSNRESVQ